MAATDIAPRPPLSSQQPRRSNDAPNRIDRITGRLSRHSVVPIATLLTCCIGLGDLGTGIETPFTILYMLPISLGVWFRGRRFGIALSALATASIGVSLVSERMSPLAIAWNVGGAAVLFLAASWGVDRLRSYVEHEHALRRMAVDQLRHAERLNVIGMLAAGVAHELGTPLSVITGCAEIVADAASDDTVRKRTSMILKQVEKISTIIRHLLDFGHRGGTAKTRLDLGALARTTSEMFESTARKRGIAIACEVGAPVYVAANASELEQVLSNLILNALQAMNHGTVHVRVASGVRADQRMACLEVEDEGSGIAAEHLARIFDPFFTTKGLGEGTGLGLSVSYGIVRDHDGSIEVVSEPRHGTRFTVLLPQCD